MHSHDQRHRNAQPNDQLLFSGQQLSHLQKAVSNSGLLAHLVRTTAKTHGGSWQADLHDNPGRVISVSNEIAITSDSAILIRFYQSRK